MSTESDFLKMMGKQVQDEQSHAAYVEWARSYVGLYRQMIAEGLPTKLVDEMLLDTNWLSMCKVLGLSIPRRGGQSK